MTTDPIVLDALQLMLHTQDKAFRTAEVASVNAALALQECEALRARVQALEAAVRRLEAR